MRRWIPSPLTVAKKRDMAPLKDCDSPITMVGSGLPHDSGRLQGELIGIIVPYLKEPHFHEEESTGKENC